MRVFFLIRQLNDGGAQRQLVELVKRLDKTKFDVTVAAFYEGGRFAKELTDVPGVRTLFIGKHGRWDVLPFLLRLAKIIRSHRPDVLYGFLGTANLLGVLLKSFGYVKKVVWGIRASNVELENYGLLARLHFRVEILLSSQASLMIANSHAGMSYHREVGFPASRMLVIPNGIDTDKFVRSESVGKSLRDSWGIERTTLLIGIVGRLDPMKDHYSFLTAAAALHKINSNVRFVCIGDGPPDYRIRLHTKSDELGLKDNVLWLGAVDDMPAAYSAIDVLTSSSAYGEGFSNVIGEAMSCGVPCVVTDVGDSALIVGNEGIVVPPCDPTALVQAWQVLLHRMFRDRPGVRAAVRQHIIKEFSADRLAVATALALEALQ